MYPVEWSLPARWSWRPRLLISNWFIRGSFALALLGVTQGTGLALMPFVAQQLITGWGWRSAWTLLGLFTMATGIIPQSC